MANQNENQRTKIIKEKKEKTKEIDKQTEDHMDKEKTEEKKETGWNFIKKKAPFVMEEIKTKIKESSETQKEKKAQRMAEKAKQEEERQAAKKEQERKKQSMEEKGQKEEKPQEIKGKVKKQKPVLEQSKKDSKKEKEKKNLVSNQKVTKKKGDSEGEKPPKKRKVRYIVLAVVLVSLVIGGSILWKNIFIPIREMYETAVAKVEVSNSDTFRAAQTSLIYDKDGDLLVTLKGDKDSYYLTYEEIPDPAKLAMISIEDKKFQYHRGIDVKAIARAGIAFLKNKGEITQGGSTITQQLSRNVFLSFETTWKRKVEEIFVAHELEKKYSKEQILEFYLNNINFSNGYYGLQAAAKGYFRKDAEDLTLSQITFLCAIPNNPTLFNPLKEKENTLARRDRILENMLNDDYISQEQYEEAIHEKIKVYKKKKTKTVNDYVETYVYYCATEMLMEQEYGFKFQYDFETTEEKEGYAEEYAKAYKECYEKLYTGGYQIHTTIDFDIQEELQDSINDGLAPFSKKTKDNIYRVQGAATCIDNKTGYVVAIVGGRKKEQGEYHTLNRAYQSFRQPGSAIKPLLVYAPFLEKTGKNPSTMVDDSPLSGENVPRNNGAYRGNIPLRQAVQVSSNVATYRLYKELTPEKALSYLEDLEFSKLSRNDYEYLTTCLGGFYHGVSTVEMAGGYAALENDGVYRKPTCISEIITKDGRRLTRTEENEKKVYTKRAARMMTDVLQSVIESDIGTARGCKLENMTAAAKTGTTNDETDGWLCGYTPYYTTAVWVGADRVEAIDGLKGSTYPAYIWTDFMTQIHKGLEDKEFPAYTNLDE